MKKINIGFSLIELMVVIAIVGILAAVAVPSYRDYIIRSHIVDVISLARADLNQLNEYFNLNGHPTDATSLAALNSAIDFTAVHSDNVTSEDILADGLRIVINGGDIPSGMSIYLRYFSVETNDIRVWHCGYGSNTTQVSDSSTTNADMKYLPNNCQTYLADITNVYGKWY